MTEAKKQLVKKQIQEIGLFVSELENHWSSQMVLSHRLNQVRRQILLQECAADPQADYGLERAKTSTAYCEKCKTISTHVGSLKNAFTREYECQNCFYKTYGNA